MNINLLTDAPKHNLALMKISAYHKAQGDNVYLMGVGCFDKTYASWLFDFSQKGVANIKGGAAVEDSVLPPEIESMKPDYSLYGLDFSLGYTFRPCYRGCPFCKVPKMNHPDKEHHSIWEFHNPKFNTIELLNNNTFFDPRWKETFEEIWDAELTVREHGFDLRLLDDEKAEALRCTRFDGCIHYAWDKMQDEKKILEGLKIAPRGRVYVLIGFDTTEEEDLYRCQKIVDHGHDPYIMPFTRTGKEKRFKRFIDTFMWRKHKTIKEAWNNYKKCRGE